MLWDLDRKCDQVQCLRNLPNLCGKNPPTEYSQFCTKMETHHNSTQPYFAHTRELRLLLCELVLDPSQGHLAIECTNSTNFGSCKILRVQFSSNVHEWDVHWPPSCYECKLKGKIIHQTFKSQALQRNSIKEFIKIKKWVLDRQATNSTWSQERLKRKEKKNNSSNLHYFQLLA